MDKAKFKIGQRVVWINNLVIEYYNNNVNLKNKLKSGLLTGTVIKTDSFNDCLIKFDDPNIENYLGSHWAMDDEDFKVKALNGIELMYRKIKQLENG